ncbi:hypothetical protein MICRO80W_80065 [Micrococcus luteus]|nr:hypothetical protein MICRO116_120082 [Micrococcus sp. 116]VWX52436.1 hypothetical protein MICRO80W_80065 [Micrococcus luteus]
MPGVRDGTDPAGRGVVRRDAAAGAVGARLRGAGALRPGPRRRHLGPDPAGRVPAVRGAGSRGRRRRGEPRGDRAERRGDARAARLGRGGAARARRRRLARAVGGLVDCEARHMVTQ